MLHIDGRLMFDEGRSPYTDEEGAQGAAINIHMSHKRSLYIQHQTDTYVQRWGKEWVIMKNPGI